MLQRRGRDSAKETAGPSERQRYTAKAVVGSFIIAQVNGDGGEAAR